MRATESRSGPRKMRVRRDALAVLTFAEIELLDRDYWIQQTPHARLRAMELLRRINYGEAAAGRIQRVFEVVQSETR